MRGRVVIAVAIALLTSVLVGYGALIRTAARTPISQRYIFSYAPNAALLVQLGPQPVCPPLVRCPTMTTALAHGVAFWWISGPTDWQTVPLWRGIPSVRQERILYLSAD